MAKKRALTKKLSTKKNTNIEKTLIENFVSLQKVMVNLSIKFDNLTDQISKLLNLFEISAKTLAQKEFDTEGNKEKNKKIIEKIDKLLEQNKTIARGLTLIHEIKNKPPLPKQFPPQQISTPIPGKTMNVNEYQKSIINPGSNPNERVRRFNQNA